MKRKHVEESTFSRVFGDEAVQMVVVKEILERGVGLIPNVLNLVVCLDLKLVSERHEEGISVAESHRDFRLLLVDKKSTCL